MALEQDLTTVVNNDVTFNLSLTANKLPYNLTGYSSITAYLKASRTAADASATTYGVGTGLTVTNAFEGTLQWAIPRADIDTAGAMWWRLDVDTNSLVTTFLFGNFTVNSA